MVAESFRLPVLIALNLGKFPLPEDGRPIEVLLLVHVNVALDMELPQSVTTVESPLHSVWFDTLVMVGDGNANKTLVLDLDVSTDLHGLFDVNLQ